jgi:DNA polymerase-3 subunit delta'
VTAAAGWGALEGTTAARTLGRMLVAGRMPHALLIAGPAQVGKAQLALLLAQALNCGERAADAGPCGECRSCQRIAEAKYADVETVGPGGLCRVSEHDHSAGASQTIGICQVRRLEMVAVTAPYEGERRVVIVDPADALTEEAADAFLKTLEEPPAAVTLVLVSARPALLPETVRSRCRRIDVAPLPVAVLAERLGEADELGQETATALARLARGRAGWAFGALAEGDPLSQRRSQLNDVRRLSEAGDAERLDFASSLTGRAGDVGPALTVLEHWREWWRDLLRARLGSGSELTHEFLSEELGEHASRYHPSDIVGFLRELQTTETLLRMGVGARVALEALVLALPRPVSPASESVINE